MSNEYPTINEVFAKEGLKCLTKRQLEIWEYNSLDKLTQDEIAIKIGISQPVVSKHLKAATEKMAKWFKEHEGLYDTLKELSGPREDEDRPNGEREAKDLRHQKRTKE